jgi:N-acetylmuramoyl-L-alanine amidase
MVKHTVTTTILLWCCVLAAAPALALPPPAKTMFTGALAHEQDVRTMLDAADALPDVLTEVRIVVAEYESLVKAYPTSGYSDNALWQAGTLALDAFAKFGQPLDKANGIRLLRKLAATYNTSRFARQVPDRLARADGNGVKDPSVQKVAEDTIEEKDAPTAAQKTPAKSSPPATPPKKADADAPQAGPPTAAQKPRPAGAIATINGIRRTVLPDTVRVIIELDAEVSFHEERLSDPSRVFVDLSGARAAPTLVDRTLRFESDADVVRQIRIGRHPNNTTRVVLDADGVTSYSVYPLYAPFRLVIDCVRAAKAAAPATVASATVAASTAASVAPAPLPSLPLPPPPAPKIPDLAAVAPIAPPTPAAPPAKSFNGGLSMARQLGLGISRIVIDAGHGGHDPGAKGKGVTEAELVLDVALRLEKLLQNLPGVEVILTRRTDDFVVLEERPAMANREGADLFLSIHANASPNAQARGIETYFLNFANNQSVAALAARENATSALAMGALPDVVKAIARNSKMDESREFAMLLQHAMVDRLRTSNKTLRDLGVKQAPFVVLIGATMPAVLAEISFVTNPQEARLVKGNAYRQRIAEALFNAIRKYQTSLKATATVAHQ